MADINALLILDAGIEFDQILCEHVVSSSQLVQALSLVLLFIPAKVQEG